MRADGNIARRVAVVCILRSTAFHIITVSDKTKK